MATFDPDEMLLQADQAIDTNDIVRARSLLHSIISEYPDYGRAHNHLGWLYERKLRYFSKAEEHYKAGLRFAPDYPATWINYGYFLAMEERYDELEKHLFQAIEVRGISKPFIYSELANMYEMKHMYEEATKYYKKSIETSLDDDKIKTYQASIERVELKINLHK